MARSDLVMKTMTNTHRDFYRLLGPFLARREVVKSVGGPIWDDDGKTWITALDGPTVLGFIAVTRTGAVESLYAPPDHTDLYPVLVTAAVRAAEGRPLHATVSRSRAAAYEQAGFEPLSETLNFIKLHRPGKTT